MNSAKKARLEAAGWKVGTAAEFLDLTKQEAAYVAMKLALARTFRQLRLRRGWSQTKVAHLIGSSQSRVAKMESGDPSVSFDLLLRSTLAVGASTGMVARAIGRRRKAAAA
jgi:DNA-binding XRE family transcriptional regulator